MMRGRSHGSRSPEEWKNDHRSGRRWKCERWCERRCDHHTILPRCQLPPRVLFDVVRQISDRSSPHLSPCKMSSNPSASLGTGQRQEPQAPPPSKGQKYSIHIEEDGAIRGEADGKWSSVCGKKIRAHIPIGYNDWRHVDKVYVDALWTSLMTEFEFNIDPILARPLLEPKFPQFFRTVKYHLRGTIKDKQGIYFPKPLALTKCPDDIDKMWWEQFISNEYASKKIEQCKKNAKNKALSNITHTLGRKSYKRVYEELEKEHPGEEATRTEVWKTAHKNKVTGNVLPCAVEKYNEVEAAEKRQKLAASANGHDGVTSTEDIETDPIAEVFGADKKSRCRAISSTFSVKQVKVRKAAKAIANQNTNPVFAKRLDNIEGLVREVLSFITTTHQPQNPLFGCGTPRTEDASNSVHPMTPRNISPVLDSPVRPVVASNNDGVAPGGKEYVVLLGRAREDVAKGFIASQSTCHGREVQDDEKIIWVTEVIKPESPVYDGPQNGVTYLCEIADGGYLIWGSKRIRYL